MSKEAQTSRPVGAMKQTGIDDGEWMSQNAANETAASVFFHVCQHTGEVTECRTRERWRGGGG